MQSKFQIVMDHGRVHYFRTNETAVSEFVIQNKVGLAVDALPDIPQKIADLSDDQYREFVANDARVAQQLRSGYYTSRALSAVE